MKKVVVERPRGGSWKPNRKFGARLRYIPGHDYENEIKRISTSKSWQYKWGEKWFTDVLGPLKRFLDCRVGRPWNDVYSELCASLDKRKVTGKHIFDHLEWMIELHCYEHADGKIYTLDRDHEVRGYYVHPRTGLLCIAPVRSRRAERREQLRSTPIERLELGNDMAYQWHSGAWYLLRYRWTWIDITNGPKSRWDILLKKKVPLHAGWNYMAIEKKQCSRAEMVKVRVLLEREQAKRTI